MLNFKETELRVNLISPKELTTLRREATLFDYLWWAEKIKQEKVDPGGLHVAANYDKHNF